MFPTHVSPLIKLFRAGGPINDETNPGLVRIPPLSVPLHQRIVEKLVKDGDGETKRIAQLQRESLAVTAKTCDSALDLVCFDVLTVSESASCGECHALPSIRNDVVLSSHQSSSFISLGPSAQFQLELNM